MAPMSYRVGVWSMDGDSGKSLFPVSLWPAHPHAAHAGCALYIAHASDTAHVSHKAHASHAAHAFHAAYAAHVSLFHTCGSLAPCPTSCARLQKVPSRLHKWLVCCWLSPTLWDAPTSACSSDTGGFKPPKQDCLRAVLGENVETLLRLFSLPNWQAVYGPAGIEENAR